MVILWINRDRCNIFYKDGIVMINEYTVKELMNKLHSDADQFKTACWYVTAYSYKMDYRELNDLLQSLLTSKYLHDSSCANWCCSLILHSLTWLENEYIEFELKKVLTSYLNFDNESCVSYAAETIARANYLYTKKELHDAISTLDKICKNNKYSSGTLQNLSLLGWSIYDFVSDADKSMIDSVEREIEKNLGFCLKNKFELREISNPCAVAFYISDFLSGKSFLQPPIAELYTATMLKNDGFDSLIFDNRLYHMSIENVISKFKQLHIKTVVADTTPYDQVGIYYVDYRLNRIVSDIRKIKQAGINVILIGSHGSIRPEEILKMTGADCVVQGESELSTFELLKKINVSNEETDFYERLNEVPNLVYCINDEYRYTFYDENMYHPDIESFPMPNYDLVETTKYYGDEYLCNEHRIRPSWGAVLAQRGCPFHCAFCYNFFGTHVRSRRPEQIVDELEVLEKKYGVQHIFFTDDTFTLNREWLMSFCQLVVQRGLKIKWNCETRVDCLDEEKLLAMKRANCYRIWLGAETFNDRLLKNANKGITEEQSLKAISNILKVGIKVSCFLMIGLPGENRDTIRYTLKQIASTGIEYTKSIITLIPREGTKYYNLVTAVNPSPSFYDLNCYKGLLDNDITELDIIKTIEVMSTRKLSGLFDEKSK